MAGRARTVRTVRAVMKTMGTIRFIVLASQAVPRDFFLFDERAESSWKTHGESPRQIMPILEQTPALAIPPDIQPSSSASAFIIFQKNASLTHAAGASFPPRTWPATKKRGRTSRPALSSLIQPDG